MTSRVPPLLLLLLLPCASAGTVRDRANCEHLASAYAAAARGSVADLGARAACGLALDMAGRDGHTPLVAAVRGGHVEAVAFLLGHTNANSASPPQLPARTDGDGDGTGPDGDGSNPAAGWAPVCEAALARAGDDTLLQLLTKAGARTDIDCMPPPAPVDGLLKQQQQAQGAGGLTPLMVAALAGNLGAVRHLLGRPGADVSAHATLLRDDAACRRWWAAVVPPQDGVDDRDEPLAPDLCSLAGMRHVTATHLAAAAQHREVVQELLGHHQAAGAPGEHAWLDARLVSLAVRQGWHDLVIEWLPRSVPGGRGDRRDDGPTMTPAQLDVALAHAALHPAAGGGPGEESADVAEGLTGQLLRAGASPDAGLAGTLARQVLNASSPQGRARAARAASFVALGADLPAAVARCYHDHDRLFGRLSAAHVLACFDLPDSTVVGAGGDSEAPPADVLLAKLAPADVVVVTLSKLLLLVQLATYPNSFSGHDGAFVQAKTGELLRQMNESFNAATGGVDANASSWQDVYAASVFGRARPPAAPATAISDEADAAAMMPAILRPGFAAVFATGHSLADALLGGMLLLNVISGTAEEYEHYRTLSLAFAALALERGADVNHLWPVTVGDQPRRLHYLEMVAGGVFPAGVASVVQLAKVQVGAAERVIQLLVRMGAAAGREGNAVLTSAATLAFDAAEKEKDHYHRAIAVWLSAQFEGTEADFHTMTPHHLYVAAAASLQHLTAPRFPFNPSYTCSFRATTYPSPPFSLAMCLPTLSSHPSRYHWLVHHFLHDEAAAKLRDAGVDGSGLCHIEGSALKTDVGLDYGQRQRFLEVRDRICRKVSENDAASKKRAAAAATDADAVTARQEL